MEIEKFIRIILSVQCFLRYIHDIAHLKPFFNCYETSVKNPEAQHWEPSRIILNVLGPLASQRMRSYWYTEALYTSHSQIKISECSHICGLCNPCVVQDFTVPEAYCSHLVGVH
jgi:hypothetical protein